MTKWINILEDVENKFNILGGFKDYIDMIELMTNVETAMNKEIEKRFGIEIKILKIASSVASY